MKATDINLVHLLNGTKQFLIPIFQRTYSWKEENCEQLFYDIVRAGESKVIDSHFIGSVVTIPDLEGQALCLGTMYIMTSTEGIILSPLYCV